MCIICSNNKLKKVVESARIPSITRKYVNETFTVWRCASCGSLHSDEQINLDKYYQDYPLKQHKLDFWAKLAYRQRLKRLLKVGLQKNSVILDYGCGQGLFIDFLISHGFKNVDGYDPYIDRFSNKEIIKDKYDFVMSQDVIEHHDNPEKLLSKLISITAKNGILCIGTPNAKEISLQDYDKNAMPLHQPYHRHILSEKAFMCLAKRHGLSLIKIYRRWYYETFFPGVNYKFIQEYVSRNGKVLDAVVEPIDIKKIIMSPTLLFYAFFGYLFPPKTEIMYLLKKK